MSLTKEQIKEIKEFALGHYKKLDYYHGLTHALRTVKLARHIAKKESANPQISELGALLHQLHNTERVSKFLKEIGVDKEVSKQLVYCVYCANPRTIKSARTKEAKVVYDADALQVIGPFGTIREISCNLVSRKRNYKDSIKHTKKVQERFRKTLQTKTGKNLAKELNDIDFKFWKTFDKWDEIKTV